MPLQGKEDGMKQTKHIALCAMLVAMALALSYTERFIPLNLLVPLPGIKLGLANIVTLMALYFMGLRPAVTVLVLRCFLNALFGGGISGLAFALTGGLLAMAAMAIARRISIFSIYGVSIFGAAAHNIGQIFAAMVLLGSTYVIAYLPLLLVVSVFTGLITATASAGTFRALRAAGQLSENGKMRR